MAGQAKTNRVSFKKGREAVYATVPAIGAKVWRFIRVVSPALAAQPQSIQSEEIREDRQVPGTILVGSQINGDVAAELSPFTYREEYEEALMRAALKTAEYQTNSAYALGDVGAVEAGNGEYNVTGSTADVHVGHLVACTGFEKPANNGVFKVTAVAGGVITTSNTASVAEATPPAGARVKVNGYEFAAGDLSATATTLVTAAGNFTTIPGLREGATIYIGSDVDAAKRFAGAGVRGAARIAKGGIAAGALTLENRPAGWAVDDGTGKSVRVYFGDLITNGSEALSCAAERSFNDIDVHEVFSGLQCNTSRLELASRRLARVTFNYIGSVALVRDAGDGGALFDDAIPATSTDAFNCGTNLGTVYLGGQAVAAPTYFVSARLETNNNLREDPAIGTASGIAGVSEGQFVAGGQVDAYFANKALLTLVLENTLTSVALGLKNVHGALYFDLPAVKLTAGAPQVPGGNATVTIPLTMSAERSAIYGHTLAVSMLDKAGQ